MSEFDFWYANRHRYGLAAHLRRLYVSKGQLHAARPRDDAFRVAFGAGSADTFVFSRPANHVKAGEMKVPVMLMTARP
jgi:hypothetical protein